MWAARSGRPQKAALVLLAREACDPHMFVGSSASVLRTRKLIQNE